MRYDGEKSYKPKKSKDQGHHGKKAKNIDIKFVNGLLAYNLTITNVKNRHIWAESPIEGHMYLIDLDSNWVYAKWDYKDTYQAYYKMEKYYVY